MKHLVAASLLFSAVTPSSRMYDRATITNHAHFPAAVTISYAACRKDVFTVPAATQVPNRNADPRAKSFVWTPGVATAPTRRGGCLITSISATLQGDKGTVTAYSSSGTSYSAFSIQKLFCKPKEPFRIWSTAQYNSATSDCKGAGNGWQFDTVPSSRP